MGALDRALPCGFRIGSDEEISVKEGTRAQGPVEPRALAADGATRRTVVEGQMSGAEVRHAREVRLLARVWLTVDGRGQYVAGVDAVAGAEFLDDRLRLTE